MSKRSREICFPLPKLNNDLEKISAKVNEHLKEINNN